jgi:hypothetical protein
MAKVTLNEVLQDAKALTLDEQRRWREVLNTFLEDAPPPSSDDELQRKLLEVGILSEIRPPVAELESYRNYQPVEVKGKPVSETVIEERR